MSEVKCDCCCIRDNLENVVSSDCDRFVWAVDDFNPSEFWMTPPGFNPITLGGAVPILL
jgi:hypothetical protein